MRAWALLLVLANVGFFYWQVQWRAAEQSGPPRAVSEPPPAGGPPTLILLKERPDAGAAHEPPEEPAAPAPVALARSCYRIGPLPSRDTAGGVAALFDGAGLSAAVAEEEYNELTGYWVRLPETFTLEVARRRLQELKGRGVSDISVAVLQDGGHVVSLGVFSRPDTTERRVAALRALGYGPLVEERHKTARRYRVAIAYVGADRAVLDAAFEALARRMPGVAPEAAECPAPGGGRAK